MAPVPTMFRGVEMALSDTEGPSRTAGRLFPDSQTNNTKCDNVLLKKGGGEKKENESNCTRFSRTESSVKLPSHLQYNARWQPEHLLKGLPASSSEPAPQCSHEQTAGTFELPLIHAARDRCIFL